MFYKTRFALSLLVFCAALTACGDNNNQTSQETATNNAPEIANTEAAEQQAVAKTETAPSTGKIEVGMSEQSVTDLLGVPTFVQTRTIDELTITLSEWAGDSGTTSVQFQNGKVQSSQFIPTNK